MAVRMGRKPLKPNDPTVKTTMRFPESLLARAAALVGENQVAKLVREALEERVERDETARGIVPPNPEPTP